MTETFVLNDGCVVDSLVLAEDPVGKRAAFPPYLDRSLREVIKIAEATVRRPVRTSLNTSIRLRSRSLIEIHPILRT